MRDVVLPDVGSVAITVFVVDCQFCAKVFIFF